MREDKKKKVMQSAVSINYSQLFTQLLTMEGEMNDTIASFLYYMFPRELFIRALSLIESSNMFIYVLASTQSELVEPQDMKEIVQSIYDDSILHRLIVKPSENDQPIYVDLNNWLCSCQEYTDLMLEEMSNHPDQNLASCFLHDIDDPQEFHDNRFAQLDAHSLSKQRYFRHEKVNCPHLLGYSILLRSSTRILKHFIQKSQILLMQVANMDEWLKLHINVVE